MPQGGLEPPTHGFSVHCYYQLSYRGKWSGRRVSNPQHPAWKASTLPIELLPHKQVTFFQRLEVFLNILKIAVCDFKSFVIHPHVSNWRGSRDSNPDLRLQRANRFRVCRAAVTPLPYNRGCWLPLTLHIYFIKNFDKNQMEIPTGLEPVNNGFAIRRLTNLAKEPQRII